MKVKLRSKKTLILLSGLCVAVALGGICLFFFKQAVPQEPALRREYPVKRDSIIVGIDAAGAVSSEKRGQFFSTPVALKEYVVKVGDFVRKGDTIAILSAQDIAKRLKDANEKLQADSFAVTKLKMEKENFQLEQDKKANEIRAAGESAYQEKASPTLTKRNTAQQGITDKKAGIDQRKAAIAEAAAQRDGRPAKVTQLAAAIAALQEQSNALQAQIDALVADAAVDHTAEIVQLTPKKAENDQLAAQKTEEKNHLESADFDAQIVLFTAEITQLEAQMLVDEADFSAAQSVLRDMETQREKDKAKENESIALLVKQGNAQHAELDQKIAQAQADCADSKKDKDHMLALQQNPQILSEHEGAVLKLGYAAGAVTEATLPLIEIGEDANKTLLLQVDPMDIAHVELGQEVSFYVDAYPDATFYGTVAAKGYVQNEKGKFEVTVSFVQGEQKLLDGMGANATLIVKQKRDIITLSNKAFFLEAGKAYVNLADEKGNLKKQEIVTGFSNGRITEIVSGLTQGDTVYVEEHYEAA